MVVLEDWSEKKKNTQREILGHFTCQPRRNDTKEKHDEKNFRNLAYDLSAYTHSYCTGSCITLTRDLASCLTDHQPNSRARASLHRQWPRTRGSPWKLEMVTLRTGTSLNSTLFSSVEISESVSDGLFRRRPLYG